MNAMESAVSHSCCVRLPLSVSCRMTPSRSIFGIWRDGIVNNMTKLLSSPVSGFACDLLLSTCLLSTCRHDNLPNLITSASAITDRRLQPDDRLDPPRPY